MMEHYGSGDTTLMEKWELMMEIPEQLQSLHLLEEMIGNKLVLEPQETVM